MNNYSPVDALEDIEEGVFNYKQYGNAIYRPRKLCKETRRNDYIMYDAQRDKAEFDANIRIAKDATHAHRNTITGIVKKYWDCFCKVGARRPILEYEFAIDTGTAKPVCCKKPRYGPYESQVMMKHLQALLKNDWVERCEGPWGSSIVLAAKPHQEHISDIKDFVWRMCVSYRKLNSITKPFEFPIPRCDDAIAIIDTGSQFIWIISLDARQGYHQVRVRKVDREKLAFFGPDGYKYTFKVMPFGPTNAPGFYLAMMRNMKEEWDNLFVTRLRELTELKGELVIVSLTAEIHIGNARLLFGTKIIIDDILLWCSNIDALFIYFECICKIFLKYRVSFRLDKCDF